MENLLPEGLALDIRLTAYRVSKSNIYAIMSALGTETTGLVHHRLLHRLRPGTGQLGHRTRLPHGYTRDGGFATATVADARFAFPLGDDAKEKGSDEALAPLLCAGLIGWRALGIAGEGKNLGLYGFGAAAHILAQVAKWQGRSIFAFTRPGDHAAQDFARSLGPPGPAAPIRRRRTCLTRQSSSPRWAISSPWHCGPCAKAAGWCAPAST